MRVFVLVLLGCGFVGAAEEKFVDLFDGRALEGWDGDPVYWSVKGGLIVGEETPETILKRNSFLIWKVGTAGDFELVAREKMR